MDTDGMLGNLKTCSRLFLLQSGKAILLLASCCGLCCFLFGVCSKALNSKTSAIFCCMTLKASLLFLHGSTAWHFKAHAKPPVTNLRQVLVQKKKYMKVHEDITFFKNILSRNLLSFTAWMRNLSLLDRIHLCHL